MDDLMKSSEDWSKAHLIVNDLLNKLLNELRDLGYNPSYHVSYHHAEQHLAIDAEILAKHPSLHTLFGEYVKACNRRDEAVERIQVTPKIDLGF